MLQEAPPTDSECLIQPFPIAYSLLPTADCLSLAREGLPI